MVSNDKEEWIVVENAHEPIISDDYSGKQMRKRLLTRKEFLQKEE